MPLGGFVNIKGQDGDQKEEPDSFGAKPLWQRFIMLFAGVGMNFLLCAVLLGFGFIAGIPTMVDDSPDKGAEFRNEQVIIMSVSPNSPAEEAGLAVGDVIIKIDEEEIAMIKQIQAASAAKAGETRQMTVLRNQEEIRVELTSRVLAGRDRPEFGVGLVKTATVSYPWYQAVYEGFKNTAGLAVAVVKAFAKILADLFTIGKVTADVAGPVGIAVLTGQVVQLGWIYVLQFAALLSINLAIINILPIPALDGGRILFLIIEKIKGRPVKQEIEGKIHQIGFVLIMALMALVIFKDLRTYGAGIWGAISQFVN